jgi:hypothetical protein
LASDHPLDLVGDVDRGGGSTSTLLVARPRARRPSDLLSAVVLPVPTHGVTVDDAMSSADGARCYPSRVTRAAAPATDIEGSIAVPPRSVATPQVTHWPVV